MAVTGVPAPRVPAFSLDHQRAVVRTQGKFSAEQRPSRGRPRSDMHDDPARALRDRLVVAAHRVDDYSAGDGEGRVPEDIAVELVPGAANAGDEPVAVTLQAEEVKSVPSRAVRHSTWSE